MTKPVYKPQIVDGILLAGGSGNRLAAKTGGKNKVLLELGGVPMFFYSLETLLAAGILRRLVLVHRSTDQQEICEVLEKSGYRERVELVTGGRERFESVRNGLELLQHDPPEVVVIHDSARPFLTPEMVVEAAQAAAEAGGATVAVPLTDTLKRGQAGMLVETLPRGDLYRIQTPQAFRYELIREQHTKLRENPDPTVTDDCMLLERNGTPVLLVPGHESNIKVTTEFDLQLAEFILEQQNRR